MLDFTRTLVHFETENNELENKIQDLSQTHDIQSAEKDRKIADRDAAIIHKEMLIEKYRICLLPYGIQIDEENGELKLGSISKRGLEEDYEDSRVCDVKKRKVDLQAELDKLEEQKEKLLAEVKDLKDKGKPLDKGEAMKGRPLAEGRD
jgi:uncharacterized protein YlxW (UPF0749 family)